METNRGVRGVRRREFLKCATAGSLAALGLPAGTGCPGQEPPARAAVEPPAAPPLRAQVGAYYFDGWAGRHKLAGNADEPWAQDAPTHLTRRMLDEFPERQPVWGWRDDRLDIMERQIDLAADHGLAFFAFCWYWHATQKDVDADPKHTGLELFLKARNNRRMKFCLLVANHQGYLIGDAQNWKQAADYWMPYLTHPQHVTIDGKPLVIIFNPSDGNRAGLENLQTAARQAGLPGVAIAACHGGAPARASRIGPTTTSRWDTPPARRSTSMPNSWRLIEKPGPAAGSSRTSRRSRRVGTSGRGKGNGD